MTYYDGSSGAFFAPPSRASPGGDGEGGGNDELLPRSRRVGRVRRGVLARDRAYEAGHARGVPEDGSRLLAEANLLAPSGAEVLLLGNLQEALPGSPGLRREKPRGRPARVRLREALGVELADLVAPLSQVHLVESLRALGSHLSSERVLSLGLLRSDRSIDRSIARRRREKNERGFPRSE